MDAGHVQVAQRRLLQLVVGQHRPTVEHQLGHQIGEVGRFALADMMLDQRGLAARTGFDQDARMTHHRCGVGPGQELQQDRFLHYAARRQAHHGALLHEGGIERRKWREVDAGEPTQRAAHGFMVFGQRLRQRQHCHPAGQLAQVGERGREHAVDKGQPVRLDGQRQRRRRGLRELGAVAQREIAPGDSAHIGVLPRLVAAGGKTERLEAGRAGLAPRGDPGWLSPWVSRRWALRASRHARKEVTSLWTSLMQQTPPRPSHSRGTPAPWPARHHRSWQCGHRPAHARSRARCSRAGAGSGSPTGWRGWYHAGC